MFLPKERNTRQATVNDERLPRLTDLAVQGQHRLAIYLSKLYDRLKDYEPEVEYGHRLDQLARAIRARETNHEGESYASRTWRAFLSSRERRDSLALTRRLTSRESALQMKSPKGLMLHGEVGTGKSMLIDLFADCLPTRKKRRWHFNTFMLETFAKLEGLRRQRLAGPQRPGTIDPEDDYSLLWLAKDLVQTNPIIFLDEFQMPDRVASKILTNLMTSFFHLGGVLVATSNRMPEELAKAAGIAFTPPPVTPGFGWGFGSRRKDQSRLNPGYNEFASFLEVLKARCEVLEMEGGKDYRRMESGTMAPKRDDLEEDEELWRVDAHEDLQHSAGVSGWAVPEVAKDAASEPVDDTAVGLSGVLPTYFAIDTDPPAQEALDKSIKKILELPEKGAITWIPSTLTIYGRQIEIPRAFDGIAMWKFSELCRTNLGPADYISLASTYHTIILTEVPVMTWLMKNEARRLITLLDALYECRCKLFVSAAAGPDDIFFPDEQKRRAAGDLTGDSVYSETLSEVYQDATAPFRPNILSQNPNYAEPENEPDFTHVRLAGLLKHDSLEDSTPIASSQQITSNSNTKVLPKPSNPFGRSFGLVDSELPHHRPRDPDDDIYSRNQIASSSTSPSASSSGTTSKPDFGKTSSFTGEDERFAYKRAQSRLWEMCSQRWWARTEEGWHRPLPVEARRWERSLDHRRNDQDGGLDGNGEGGDVKMGGSREDRTRDERSFRRVERFVEAEKSNAEGEGEERKALS
jgi:predicted ATPase